MRCDVQQTESTMQDGTAALAVVPQHRAMAATESQQRQPQAWKTPGGRATYTVVSAAMRGGSGPARLLPATLTLFRLGSDAHVDGTGPAPGKA